MNLDHGIQALYLILAMMLPLSALAVRRLSLRRTVIMIAAWIGIILIVMLAIGIVRRSDAAPGWARLMRLLGDDPQQVEGGLIRIRMAPDGHFWATAAINGIEQRMLIDSGATTTALSLATAQAAMLDLDQNPVRAAVTTGNGMVFVRTSSVRRLILGPIVAKDLRVVVAPEFGDTDVLGMNFLSRLKSWRVEGNMLVLEPAR